MTSMLIYSHSLLADCLLIHTHQTGWNKEKKNNPKYLQVQILICGNRHTKKGNMDILWNVTTHF